MIPFSNGDIEEAHRHEAEAARVEPRAAAIVFNALSCTFTITLTRGTILDFHAHQLPELADAAIADWAEVSVVNLRKTVSWPRLGLEIPVPDLVMRLTWGPEWPATMTRLLSKR